jgi:hypothetical protein
MRNIHDSTRQVSYLQQCLSQDKRNIGFLLGAGCPLSIQVPAGTKTEPLIPDVEGLTDFVARQLRTTHLKTAFEKIEYHLQTDGCININIETQLSFIRGLKAIAGDTKVRDLSVDELVSLEGEICRLIGERVDRQLPESENPYTQLAAWIASTNRSAPVEVFTTNYDLLSEQALELFRVPYFDGFSGSKEAFLDSHSIDHDELPPRWARLWKLHGSINWTINEGKQVCRIGACTGNCVIHPSHLKYDESRRMPYLAMFDRLRAFIRKPSSALIICGYSFRDEHLNACLVEGLTGSPRSALFGLLYGNLSDYPEAVKLAGMVGNLSLLARDGALLGTRKGVWDNRDLGDAATLSGAVELTPDPAAGTAKIAIFHLGDFASLGRFLAALIGNDMGGSTYGI